MKLSECTPILRSKNAGPFCLTIDLLYHNSADYQMVKSSGILNKDTISALYKVSPEKVQLNYYDYANGIKVSLPREVGCGSYEDIDVYGAQQHMPLMDLQIPE